MYREINNETSSQHTRAGKNVMEKKLASIDEKLEEMDNKATDES